MSSKLKLSLEDLYNSDVQKFLARFIPEGILLTNDPIFPFYHFKTSKRILHWGSKELEIEKATIFTKWQTKYHGSYESKKEEIESDPKSKTEEKSIDSNDCIFSKIEDIVARSPKWLQPSLNQFNDWEIRIIAKLSLWNLILFEYNPATKKRRILLEMFPESSFPPLTIVVRGLLLKLASIVFQTDIVWVKSQRKAIETYYSLLRKKFYQGWVEWMKFNTGDSKSKASFEMFTNETDQILKLLTEICDIILAGFDIKASQKPIDEYYKPEIVVFSPSLQGWMSYWIFKNYLQKKATEKGKMSQLSEKELEGWLFSPSLVIEEIQDFTFYEKESEKHVYLKVGSEQDKIGYINFTFEEAKKMIKEMNQEIESFTKKMEFYAKNKDLFKDFESFTKEQHKCQNFNYKTK